MPRTILIQLDVTIPDDDKRSEAKVVSALEDALLIGTDHPSVNKLVWRLKHVEVPEAPVTVFTVHPFDDEWVWDPERSGAYPWATGSLQEAIDHANLVRLEYASTEGVDPEWVAGFWSAIYEDPVATEGDESARADSMTGFVDPWGNYHEGDEPPIDENSNWIGKEEADDD